jgi:hypothetical protein
VRQLLAQHPSIEKEGARARLTSFGAQAIEIELFAYVMTADYAAFLEIRESLLLQVAQIVESSGSAFAVPTQFIYMRSEVDENRPIAGTPLVTRAAISRGVETHGPHHITSSERNRAGTECAPLHSAFCCERAFPRISEAPGSVSLEPATRSRG